MTRRTSQWLLKASWAPTAAASLVALLSFTASASAAPTTVSAPPRDDATFHTACALEGSPDLAAGLAGAASSSCSPYADTTLSAGASGEEVLEAAVSFDLSAVPPGAAIVEARLNAYFYACLPTDYSGGCPSVNHRVDVHRVDSAWSRWSPNWPPPAHDATVAASFTIPQGADPRWVSWDVTTLVREWTETIRPNYGVLLKRDGEWLGAGGAVFFGKDVGDPGLRPTLTVTYEADEAVLQVGQTPYGPVEPAAGGFAAYQEVTGEEGIITDGETEYIEGFVGEDYEEDYIDPICCGSDQRRQIGGTLIRRAPYRRVSHVEGTSGGCTGFLISANTLVTAAHCLFHYGNRSWKTITAITPARDGGTAPYGRCGVKVLDGRLQMAITTGYYLHELKGADFGVIKLDCDVGSRTGWFGLIRNPDGGLLNARSITEGYPSDKPYGTMWRSIDQVQRMSTNLMFTQNDAYYSQSGSPFHRGSHATCKFCVMGILTRADIPPYTYGPRMTRTTIRTLNRWRQLERLR